MRIARIDRAFTISSRSPVRFPKPMGRDIPPCDDAPPLPSGTTAEDRAAGTSAWGVDVVVGLAAGGLCFFSHPQSTQPMQIKIDSLSVTMERLHLAVHRRQSGKREVEHMVRVLRAIYQTTPIANRPVKSLIATRSVRYCQKQQAVLLYSPR